MHAHAVHRLVTWQHKGYLGPGTWSKYLIGGVIRPVFVHIMSRDVFVVVIHPAQFLSHGRYRVA